MLKLYSKAENRKDIKSNSKVEHLCSETQLGAKENNVKL